MSHPVCQCIQQNFQLCLELVFLVVWYKVLYESIQRSRFPFLPCINPQIMVMLILQSWNRICDVFYGELEDRVTINKCTFIFWIIYFTIAAYWLCLVCCLCCFGWVSFFNQFFTNSFSLLPIDSSDAYKLKEFIDRNVHQWFQIQCWFMNTNCF